MTVSVVVWSDCGFMVWHILTDVFVDAGKSTIGGHIM